MSSTHNPPRPPALRSVVPVSSEAETSKGSSDESPNLFSRMARSVCHWLLFWAPLYALMAVFVLGGLYLSSLTSITATLDGQPINTPILVNHKYIGDTPYIGILPDGEIEIEVLVPRGLDGGDPVKWTTFSGLSCGPGNEGLVAKFTSRDVDDGLFDAESFDGE